ncbi:MAG: exo-alpha-sialidase, partial [Actinobacteria bacterium]|nr:exo-alpha-sialidase [Actinomycetota bacterium]
MLVLAAAVTLAACGTTTGIEVVPPSVTPAADGQGSAQPISGEAITGHIHNLAYDGTKLLFGTHEGLWGQAPGSKPVLVSVEPFDVMGLTNAGNRWLASGHPGMGMDAPADLGLLQSTDQGQTWTELSLGGEVDFHRLAASSAVIVGLNAHEGRLLRSDNGGTAWTDLGVPGLYDLAVNPADPAVIVGTTENGPVRSID